jgi:hypothetical protein
MVVRKKEGIEDRAELDSIRLESENAKCKMQNAEAVVGM